MRRNLSGFMFRKPQSVATRTADQVKSKNPSRQHGNGCLSSKEMQSNDLRLPMSLQVPARRENPFSPIGVRNKPAMTPIANYLLYSLAILWQLCMRIEWGAFCRVQWGGMWLLQLTSSLLSPPQEMGLLIPMLSVSSWVKRISLRCSIGSLCARLGCETLVPHHLPIVAVPCSTPSQSCILMPHADPSIRSGPQLGGMRVP